ncbi:hypothetical protein PGT21_031541 [Puccinia graminis f. sp. tritici]|uniref:Uncharacterized protein n=1 Tax=Puccinia graminis f. sp. tritici TaxID=56615 RepID=A0A5B0QC38_PUCGR|nr:hypothetical protein PGT21_031541 [Puccinia graminis f. sp. tritici]
MTSPLCTLDALHESPTAACKTYLRFRAMNAVLWPLIAEELISLERNNLKFGALPVISGPCSSRVARMFTFMPSKAPDSVVAIANLKGQNFLRGTTSTLFSSNSHVWPL